MAVNILPALVPRSSASCAIVPRPSGAQTWQGWPCCECSQADATSTEAANAAVTAAEAAFDSVADAEDSHRDDFQVLNPLVPLLVTTRKSTVTLPRHHQHVL